MKRRSFLWATLALVAASAALADDKTVTLARTVKKDEVTRYKSIVTASVMGLEAVVTATAKSTVKEVKENGQVVVEDVTENGKLSLGGMEQEMPNVPPVTFTRDKYGKLVKFVPPDGMALMSPEVMQIIATINEIIFPEKPVAENGSWESTFDNPAVKDKKFTVKTTYLGTEKVDGADLWKIKQSAAVETDASGAKLDYAINYFVDPTNGRVVKSSATLKDVPTMYGVMTMDMKMSLIKETATK